MNELLQRISISDVRFRIFFTRGEGFAIISKFYNSEIETNIRNKISVIKKISFNLRSKIVNGYLYFLFVNGAVTGLFITLKKNNPPMPRRIAHSTPNMNNTCLPTGNWLSFFMCLFKFVMNPASRVLCAWGWQRYRVFEENWRLVPGNHAGPSSRQYILK